MEGILAFYIYGIWLYVWVIARPGGYEAESSKIEKEGSAEALTIAKTVGHCPDLLDSGVERFADAIGR